MFAVRFVALLVVFGLYAWEMRMPVGDRRAVPVLVAGMLVCLVIATTADQ